MYKLFRLYIVEHQTWKFFFYKIYLTRFAAKMIKVTSYHYYVEAGYGPFARLTDVTKTVRVWPHGETFKLNVLHGQRHEAVVLLDVPLEDVRARSEDSLEPRPVQLDTLERPHGSHGGSSGPVQHESDLSEVVGGSEDAHLLAVLALVPELGDGGVPATVHGHHHHTSLLSGFNVIEAVRAKLLQSGRRSCLANSVNFLYFWFLEMTLYYFREENFLNSWPTFVLFAEFSFYLSLSPVNNDIEVVARLALPDHSLAVLEWCRLQGVCHRQSLPLVQVLWTHKIFLIKRNKEKSREENSLIFMNRIARQGYI